MATILLSIKPEYVDKIFAGTKKYEYRKRLSKLSVDKIIVYSTDPVKKVIGEVSVIGMMQMSPSRLWEQTKAAAGISRSMYRQYFKNCKQAFAYQLGSVEEYDVPKDLMDFGITQAPQSFVYIEHQKETENEPR